MDEHPSGHTPIPGTQYDFIVDLSKPAKSNRNNPPYPAQSSTPHSSKSPRRNPNAPKVIHQQSIYPTVEDRTHLYRRDGWTWCGQIAAEVKLTEVQEHCTCNDCQGDLQDYIDSFEHPYSGD